MATWIGPPTLVDGDYLSFTTLNAVAGDGGDLHWLKNALAAVGVTASTGSPTVDSAFAGCRVMASGSQQIPDSSWTALSWGQQRWGKRDGADFDFLSTNNTNVVHIPHYPQYGFTGFYVVGVHIEWAANATGQRGVRLRSYGSDLTGGSSVIAQTFEDSVGASQAMAMSLSTFGNPLTGGGILSGGDNIACEVYQNSGDNLSVNATPSLSAEMWCVRLGAAQFVP